MYFFFRTVTAPVGYNPIIKIIKSGQTEERILQSDDAFSNSIKRFVATIQNKEKREEEFRDILTQAAYVEQFSQSV